MLNACFYDVHAIVLSSAISLVFLLQLLITFSVPVVSSLYFLWTSEAGGVRFGMWGWCLQEDGTCLTPQLGYTWGPQISVPITGTLVFYPIGAILTFFTMLSLVPILVRGPSQKAKHIFWVFVVSSFIVSLFAFIFMIAMWNVAKIRFRQAGFDANFGPLPWLSLSATLVLLAVMLVSRCPRPKDPASDEPSSFNTVITRPK